MKLTTLLPTASSSQEKARIHVVYALLGTVFFMPLQIIAMEACLILALILAARYIWKYPVASWHDTPLFKPAALFAVLAFISLAGSPKPLFGVAFYLFTVLQYFIFYNLIVVFVRGGEERRLFLLVFLASAAAVVLFGLYQYAHMLTLHEEEWVDNSAFPLLRRRMYSTLYNPNLLSEFLLMAISATFSLLIVKKRAPKKMAVLLTLLAALALCLILTYSRGAWLSAGALVFFFGLVWDKRLWLSFLCIPFLLAFYHGGVTHRLLSIFYHSSADTSVSMRMDMWLAALQMVGDHPMLGIGWGAFKFVYPVYNELIQQAGITIFHAHNMYLNILAETGIAGFCAFFWLFFGAAVYAVRFLRLPGIQPQERAMALMTAASILAVAVSSFSDYDLFSTQISLTLWFLLGLFSNMHEEYGKRAKKSLRNNSQ